jgi:hypothetical protein
MHFSDNYRSDNGEPIKTYWESGAMDFGNEGVYKTIQKHQLSLKPEPGGRITFSVETDKSSNYSEKDVFAGYFTFEHMDFENFSFDTNHKPRMETIRLKANRFTTMKLIYSSESASSTATIQKHRFIGHYGARAK